MPKLTFDTKEIVKHVTIARKLKQDELTKGRLALGTEFFKDPVPFDPEKEEIWVIRRRKRI